MSALVTEHGKLILKIRRYILGLKPVRLHQCPKPSVWFWIATIARVAQIKLVINQHVEHVQKALPFGVHLECPPHIVNDTLRIVKAERHCRMGL